MDCAGPSVSPVWFCFDSRTCESRAAAACCLLQSVCQRADSRDSWKKPSYSDPLTTPTWKSLHHHHHTGMMKRRRRAQWCFMKATRAFHSDLPSGRFEFSWKRFLFALCPPASCRTNTFCPTPRLQSSHISYNQSSQAYFTFPRFLPNQGRLWEICTRCSLTCFQAEQNILGLFLKHPHNYWHPEKRRVKDLKGAAALLQNKHLTLETSRAQTLRNTFQQNHKTVHTPAVRR